MFKRYFWGQLAVIASVAALLNACGPGEIGGTPQGDSRSGDSFDDVANPSGRTPVLKCSDANPDVAARNGWRSSNANDPADGTLRFEVKARPTAANLDGLVAVGAESIDSFDDAAIAVRFADNGLVGVRDGALYASDMAYPYEAGVWYSIGVLADIDNQTYDVEIGPCGEPRETLIKRASFRDNAKAWGRLSTWAVWSSQTAALEVSTPSWVLSGGCVPATCESLGQECGQPSDGCGGTLECGGCGNTELCDSGLCVEELVTVPSPPACVPDTCEVLSIECGVRSDGCGDYIACGACPSGYSCDSGVCVQDPTTSSPPPACAPETCDSLSRECGVASDGCGGALSCGSCGSGETCTSGGTCVATTTPPPACVPHSCESLGRECGSVSDGCGGSLSCGGCPSGESCSSGVCVGDSEPPPDPVPTPPSEECLSNVWANLEGCGWAGPSNTGHSTSTPLRATSARTIKEDGTLVENERITGGLVIDAKNVTIRNSWITSSFGSGAAANATGVVAIRPGASVTIESCTLDGSNRTHAGIWYEGNSLVARANEILGVNDGIFSWDGDNFTIEDNYLHGFTTEASNGHVDGFQTEGASHGVIRHNTIDVSEGQTAAISIWNSRRDSTDILVEENLLSGGGFTVYAQDYHPSESAPSGGNSVLDIRFFNNRFSTVHYPCVGRWGAWFVRGAPTDGWNRSGNVVLETGANIDMNNPFVNGIECR